MHNGMLLSFVTVKFWFSMAFHCHTNACIVCNVVSLFHYFLVLLWQSSNPSYSVSDLPSLCSDLPVHAQFPVNQALSTSITPCLFHSRLKTHLFHKFFPPQTRFLASRLPPRLYDWTVSSCFSFLHYYFCLVPCGRLSWLCQLLGAHKSYRIVS